MPDVPHIEKPEEYRFDLEREIGCAYSLYPELRDRIFFVRVDGQKPGDNPAFSCYGDAWNKFRDRPEANDVVRKAVSGALTRGVSCAVRSPEIKEMHFIILNTPRHGVASIDAAFTFDHELGHQIVPSGFAGSKEVLMGESAADAFASLRCLQRFGEDAGLKILTKEYMDRLANPLRTHMREDWIHLTASVLLQITKDEGERHFEALSPKETVEQAEYYALRFSPSTQKSKEQWAELQTLVKPDKGKQDAAQARILEQQSYAKQVAGAARQARKRGRSKGRLLFKMISCFGMLAVALFWIAYSLFNLF